MGRIQNTPEGLLDLLGSKVGGRYPDVISDSAVPTVSLNGLLRGRRIATAVANSLTSAVNDSAELTVPEGEVWEVFAIDSIVSATAAAQLTNIRIQLENLANSADPQEIIIVANHVAPVGSAAVHAMAGTTIYDEPLVLPAGTLIKAIVSDTVHAGLLWSFHVGHYKLQQ